MKLPDFIPTISKCYRTNLNPALTACPDLAWSLQACKIEIPWKKAPLFPANLSGKNPARSPSQEDGQIAIKISQSGDRHDLDGLGFPDANTVFPGFHT